MGCYREPSTEKGKKGLNGPLIWMALASVSSLLTGGLLLSGVLNKKIQKPKATSWVLIGRLTASSVDFRILGGANLTVSESSDYQSPIRALLLDESTELASGVHGVRVDNLYPQTKYYYSVETTVHLPVAEDNKKLTGSFTTAGVSGEAFDFRIALGNCADTGAESDVFQYIQDQSPLLMLHTGDIHYEDLDSEELQPRVDAVSMVMHSESQASLYAHVPLAYMWDDHDWTGNDSSADKTSRDASNVAMESYGVLFPHYNFASSSAPYQAFTVGTVRFILSDLRSENDGKSMYSETQKQWLFAELEQAGNYDFVVWVTTKPWIGEAGDDSWQGHVSDRRELSDFISSVVPKNLIAISGDMHAIAFDDGSNTYYGNEDRADSFPIFHAGPFARPSSIKGGPFSDGCYATFGENNHYGTIDFIFQGGTACMEIKAFAGNETILERTLCDEIFVRTSKDGDVGAAGTCMQV